MIKKPLLVAFKNAAMDGVGPTEMVGISPDGTAKIALVEPQH